MLRKMKIGAKLSLAFGVLLLIVAGVAATSRGRMRDVQMEVESLAGRYVPEMVLAADVQQRIQKMMYEVRGYNFTSDKAFLETGRDLAESARQAVKRAAGLAERHPTLTALRDGAAQAGALLEEYVGLIDGTESAVNTVAGARERGYESARLLVETIEAYIESQNGAMTTAIDGGEEKAQLRDRLNKITLANKVLDVANAIRIDNFVGQATRDIVRLEGGLERFPEIESLVKEIRGATKRPVNLEQLDAVQKAAEEYKSGMETIRDNWRRLDEINRKRIDTGQSILEIADKLAQKAAAHSLEIAAQSFETLAGTITIVFAAMAAAILFGVVVAIVMTRSITIPLKHVVDLFSILQSGDLRANVSGPLLSRGDEIGALGRAFQALTENLRTQIASVKETADSLASSAFQIAASISEVTAGAEETSVAVVETTATMEEVRTTAEATHAKSREVAEIARQGLVVLQTGETAIEALFNGMEKIGERMASIAETIVRLSEQSQEVGEITETVEDLAEQSNLLAVNASIEASKAGEQGRGFSVVAQEIKSLADQSKGSAREVHRILRDIQKATSAAVMAIEQGAKVVEQGTKDAVPSRESMKAIARSFTESARSAAQIASANNELLGGIGQVAEAMESIKAAGEQNVSGMRELDSASASLKETGRNLKLLVERYIV